MDKLSAAFMIFLLSLLIATNGQSTTPNCDNGQIYSDRINICEDSMANDCLSNEIYDMSTNECVRVYDWGEIRRDINLNIRYVFNEDGQMTGNNIISPSNQSNETSSFIQPNNDTNCNHGTYLPANQTCQCEDGWRTSPIQDLFHYVWCNESVFDEEYYGESSLTENKAIGFQLTIVILVITFVFTFLLKVFIKIISKCFHLNRNRHQRHQRSRRKRKHKQRKHKQKKYEMVTMTNISDEDIDQDTKHKSKKSKSRSRSKRKRSKRSKSRQKHKLKRIDPILP